MNEIQLIYARNIISTENGHVTHELEFAVLVKNLAFEKQVSIHWVGNDHVRHTLVASYSCRSGEEYHQSPCALQKNHTLDHDRKSLLEKMSTSLWTACIKAPDADTMQYAIGCETANGEIWDNNRGSNYTARSARLKVLTLNLHCYQENDQDEKFNEIVRAIDEVDIDIICLQEVGEDYNDGKGDQQTNAARILRHRLRQCGRFYFLFTDWSHIGFFRYREGSAILNRYQLLKRDAAYVSAATDIHSIHARKVVMGQIDFFGLGLINIFSVHLSWWKDGFWAQFEKLQQWATDAEKADGVAATLLCGDFNTKAGSQGYMMIADGGKYADQFLQAASPAFFAEVFGNASPERAASLADDDRIDYIFAKKNTKLNPITAKVLFSGQDYRRVSDHLGYLVEFEPSCGQE